VAHAHDRPIQPICESAFVPWTSQLNAWFNLNYRLVGGNDDVSVYRNEFVSPI
jgi:hypothetical protein